MTENEKKNKIRVSAARPRKLRKITLPEFNFDKKKNDKVFIHFTPFSHSDKKFLHNCVSRASFNSGGNPSVVAASTASSINYLLKNEDVPLLSSDDKLTEIQEAQKFFEGKRILRLMISPEDDNAPLEKCIENTISYLEGVMGQPLTYLAAVHTDTDIRHAHIIISREDGGTCSKTNLLTIPKDYLIGGARQNMRYTITNELGFLDEKEYYEKYTIDTDKLGTHKIDYLIQRNLVFYDGKATLNKVEIAKKMPRLLREPLIKRLDALSTFGQNCGVVKNEDNLTYTFYNTSWQEYLRAKDKSHYFKDITGYDNVIVDNYEIFKTHRFYEYEGTLVSKRIIDDDIGRIAFLIKKDDDNSFHYAESTMAFPKYQVFEEGDEVRIRGTASLSKYKDSIKRKDRISIVKIDKETRKAVQVKRETKSEKLLPFKAKVATNETKY